MEIESSATRQRTSTEDDVESSRGYNDLFDDLMSSVQLFLYGPRGSESPTEGGISPRAIDALVFIYDRDVIFITI